MFATVRVNGDAVSWVVSIADIGATASEIAEASAPVVLPVLSPAIGRLILSPQAAATVTLLPPSGMDVIPSHDEIPAARIYLPFDTQDAHTLPGYALVGAPDLEQLEQLIVDTMTNGTVTTLSVLLMPSTEGPGAAILNGASLPYAVIIPVSIP